MNPVDAVLARLTHRQLPQAAHPQPLLSRQGKEDLNQFALTRSQNVVPRLCSSSSRGVSPATSTHQEMDGSCRRDPTGMPLPVLVRPVHLQDLQATRLSPFTLKKRVITAQRVERFSIRQRSPDRSSMPVPRNDYRRRYHNVASPDLSSHRTPPSPRKRKVKVRILSQEEKKAGFPLPTKRVGIENPTNVTTPCIIRLDSFHQKWKLIGRHLDKQVKEGKLSKEALAVKQRELFSIAIKKDDMSHLYRRISGIKERSDEYGRLLKRSKTV